jgi:hypothetical protein
MSVLHLDIATLKSVRKILLTYGFVCRVLSKLVIRMRFAVVRMFVLIVTVTMWHIVVIINTSRGTIEEKL